MKDNKKAIISRLVESGVITFDEALILMETETVEKVIEKTVIKEIPTDEKPIWPVIPFKPYDPIRPKKENPYWLTEAKKRYDQKHLPNQYIIETIHN